MATEERRELFWALRREFDLHRIEKRWNAPAEVILEALDRSAELTQRMFLGVLAEAACKVEVIDRLVDWRDVAGHGNIAADFVIERQGATVSIQVKLLRKQQGVPLRADSVRHLGSDQHYVVETQKTRGGKDASGNDTRPYRFSEFDILAVSLFPLTRRWRDFVFVPSRWLIPRSCDPKLIAVYQPVAPRADDDWTDSLPACIERLQGAVNKTIAGCKQKPPNTGKSP